ncbi:MAG: class B sortase [Eubacterium sp.]|nr:class B sortase [Eubacterium sp.]
MRTRKVILRILLLIAIAAMGFSLWKLWSYYKVYHNGKKEYEDLTQFVDENPQAEEETTAAEGKKKDICPIKVDFDELKKVNPDVIGWLHIPDTGINYPIVQGQDNSYYLHRTFKKESSYVGAIFMDVNCKPDFTSFNSIIYGHNLKNGEMFGHLKGLYDLNYNSKADYKKHSKIWVVTPKENREYDIFAAREINVDKDMDVYYVEFASKEEYKTYLASQVEKSQYKTKAPVSEDRSMITLSTCTSTTETGRFIVQATRIQ